MEHRSMRAQMRGTQVSGLSTPRSDRSSALNHLQAFELIDTGCICFNPDELGGYKTQSKATGD